MSVRPVWVDRPRPLGLPVADEHDLVRGHARSLPRGASKTAPHAHATGLASVAAATVLAISMAGAVRAATNFQPGPLSIDPTSGLAGTTITGTQDVPFGFARGNCVDWFFKFGPDVPSVTTATRRARPRRRACRCR